jgi:hypothetical protein
VINPSFFGFGVAGLGIRDSPATKRINSRNDSRDWENLAIFVLTLKSKMIEFPNSSFFNIHYTFQRRRYHGRFFPN